MLPAPIVAAVLGGCFPYFPEVLKVHRLLREEVPAPVAQPLPVVLAHYQDRETNGRPGKVPFLSFLW